DGYFASYSDAIIALSEHSNKDDIRENPGISIKLSALHPRYEVSQKQRVMEELVPRVKALALLAKKAEMGLNIDAEEADRLDISLDVIEAVLRSDELKGWDGFGVVVQAYSKRASGVIEWLYALSKQLDRKIMVRLVKGAYWDTEIKQAQVDGVEYFPVFTKKPSTDVSYICCAQQLLNMTDRIYPQFATHNAHSVAAILELASDKQSFEFQRLHGMGEGLHEILVDREKTRCRIYAPVGTHKDLLAYLVRRLLENGANSSFVNQIIDTSVSAEIIAADPIDTINEMVASTIKHPTDLFQPERINSQGWDLRDLDDLAKFEQCREVYKDHKWHVTPMVVGDFEASDKLEVFNPANSNDMLGTVQKATFSDVVSAIDNAKDWQMCEPKIRSEILLKAADLFEENSGEIFAALCREAGKSALDAVAEIREAVDFLRYYAAQATVLNGAEARGLITCISPWNFPLAIFTGQIAAALAAGNGVLAKPADPTPIVASIGVGLLHRAGVPKDVLQLLPGSGAIVGAKLTSDARIKGVCFTGSTAVAQTINKVMAQNLEPDAILIAETGGINAMIVDSTALPQQAVKDIVDSAFQSAGQRCSALRILYIQSDIAEEFLEMLYGAMDELKVDNPWALSTDLGPVITEVAKQEMLAHIENARQNGALMKQVDIPQNGIFVAPSVIKVSGINDLEKEIFGPVLHVATFEASEVDSIINDINNKGFGLTFGLHTRIDERVEKIT
ncbi:MAG: bifunctional proline dehydrogenase/L-glutamate gamma-semialdehyde dehydrogenase PutA, partial [Rhizobiales bacterium]|nr:bifunctional proline dehydrogenase/L-glutamate gamma-semialdehyde dehydrogenase PutA [Hyphomicrobiales bacterium]